MQPYFPYEVMLEERITADRGVQIVCERLWAGVLTASNCISRRPSAGRCQRVLTDLTDSLKQRPRDQIVSAGVISGYYAGAFDRANACVLVALGQRDAWLL